MQDKPTPSPSDPDKTESEPDEQSKEALRHANPLKLKRVVIKDTEIKPGEGKDWEPTPESQPFEEVVEDPVPLMPIPLTAEQIGTPSAAPDPEDFSDEELDDELEADELELEKRKLSPALRLAMILGPALVICAAMVFIIRTFDPFGDGLAPIAPVEIPASIQKNGSVRAEAGTAEESGLSGKPLEETRTSLQGFLNALQEQPLTVSTSPRGVFINSVFIPEGMPLNKQVGVIFSSLLIEEGKAFIIVSSPDGTRLTLPADYMN